MSVAVVEFGDGVSIALGVELGHGAVGEVAPVGCGPFVVHVGEDGSDESDDGGFVREDPYDAAASFEAFMSRGRVVGRLGLVSREVVEVVEVVHR